MHPEPVESRTGLTLLARLLVARLVPLLDEPGFEG
jgi:hypothetical protein